MSGAGLSIRVARPSEQPLLLEIQKRASLALDDYREQLESHPDAIALPIAQLERGHVFVADVDGVGVGYSALDIGEDGAELDGLFVEPDRQRQGIGRKLVERAVHEARREGLSLWVIANPGAVGFYQRCGFQVEGDVRTRFGPAVRMTL